MTTNKTASLRAELHPWRAFFLALLLYFLLLYRDLSAWSRPVWATLAFVLIPGLCAFALGKSDRAGKRIHASLWSVGLAMGLYTGFNLIRVHRLIGSSDGVGGVFLVGLFVAAVYALLAGGVGALIGLAWDRVGAKQ